MPRAPDLARRLAVARGEDAGRHRHPRRARAQRLHARVARGRRRDRRRRRRRARRLRGRARRSTPSGRFLVPGFVDPHLHIESSKLLLDEFARLVLPLGTTAVVADPHEIANVLGSDGVHWLLDAAAGLPLDVYFMASSCVPASRVRVAAARAHDRRSRGAAAPLARARGRRDDELPRRRRGRRQHELAKLAARPPRRRPRARASRGKALNAYAAAGIGSDHEAASLEEGRERLRAGMWLLIREASGARNLARAAPARARVRAAADGLLHRRPRARAHRRRRAHQRDRPRRGRRSASARGRDRDGLVQPGLLPRPLPPRRDRPRLPGRRPASSTSSSRSCPALVLKRGRPVGGDRRRSPVPEWARRTVHVAALGAEDFADSLARAGRRG